MQTFKKLRKTYRTILKVYRRKKKKLSSDTQKTFEEKILAFYHAIKAKDKPLARSLLKELEELEKKHFPKSVFEKWIDYAGSLIFALVIAVLIRQMWFEFFTIPTGSMRPTFKEGDFLVVNKTNFGLNVPLTTSHFYFDPKLILRGGATIFTSANMDMADSDTMYFYLFPGKKQLIKRLIAKPGDTIYFYGGKIYGFDEEGNDLTVFRDGPWFNEIEHIPFIHLDGKVDTPSSAIQGVHTPSIVYQMNEPVAKIEVSPFGQVEGKLLHPKGQNKGVDHYYNLWGFRNFAMARILTQEEVLSLTDQNPPGDAPLFLELVHHPTFHPPKLSRDYLGRLRPDFSTSTSIIPLYSRHLHAIMNNMYTSRFVVKNGHAYPYGMTKQKSTAPAFPDVPDGTYEFDRGVLYRIEFGGIPREMPKTHPLYNDSDERIQKLYNLGIEFNTYFSPRKNNVGLFPSRYAYYREGDLYLLNNPIFSKDDPTLQRFVQREKQKRYPENPFLDYGPPLLADGRLDKEFIKKYGLKIPEKGYLMLGDNHAQSGDSRVFGFVPEENIKGGAGVIFWPPSKRWGYPFQPAYPWFNVPRVIVFIIFGIVIILSFLYYRRKWKNPPFQK